MDGISATVEAAFQFLRSDYGFSVIERSADRVTFSRPGMSLQVTHELPSQMVFVTVIQGEDGDVYDLHELLSAIAPSEVHYAYCSAATEPKLKEGVDQLARTCRTYLDAALRGDENTWDQITTFVRESRRKSTLQAQFGPVKERANQAWERKDWRVARVLYQEAAAALSPTEQRRLAYLVKLD